MTVHEAFLEQDLLDLQNKVEEKEKRMAELEKELAISEHDREHNDYELTEVYKKIAELEKEVTRLRNENLDIINKYTRFAETDRRTIAELEKENAELKAKNKWYSEQVCNNECAEVWGNLTKAKELLKRWLRLYNTNTVKGIIADTEKFLNSEGK